MEEHRLAAIMFTDIVGYTALMGKNEDRAFDVLRINREIHNTLLERYSGKLIKEMGDGMLASFASASDAVRCAIEIQQEAKAENISLRIGIHEGETVFAGTDILGDGVNVASRLQALAEEGTILISGTVHREIKNKERIHTDYLGEKTLKNVDEPVKVYKVSQEEKIRNVDSKAADNKEGRKNKKYRYLIISAIILAVISIVIWKFWASTSSSPQPGVSAGKDKSIAVKPFINDSEDKGNAYFANGIMEEVLNNLSKIKDMEVRSRTSTEKYRETKLTAKEIGDELKVNYLLEGSVQKQGNQVKIHAQLIDVTYDRHIWSETYLRSLDSVFVVQSEIAKSIANSLQSVITPEEKQLIESIPTKNLTAYDLFLKAKDRFYSDKFTDAIDLCKQAINLDPQFALAYIWLGRAIYQKNYASDYFKKSLGDSLMYYANKGLSIDPNLAEAYWIRGQYYFDNGKYAESIDELKKAIGLNPNHGDSYNLLGIVFGFDAQYLNSVINEEKAKKLKTGEPDYITVLNNLWAIYISIGDLERMETVSKEILKIDSSWSYNNLWSGYWLIGDLDKMKFYVDKDCSTDSTPSCYRGLCFYYSFTGNFNQALYYIEKARREMDKTKDSLTYLRWEHRYAYILYNTGRKKEAEKYFNKQIRQCLESIRLKRDYSGFGGKYDLAGIYAFLGEKEKAYKLVHEMEESKTLYWCIIKFMQGDPLYKNLWGDQEFKLIIGRTEKKYAAIRAEIQQLRDEGKL
jgi:adenylate cyclase